MRVSRLRESNLLSVGWSWLLGVFPPAYRFLCNIHCNSADRHLLACCPRRPESVDRETGVNSAPCNTCLAFHFCFSSPEAVQESPKHLLSPFLYTRHSTSRSGEHLILSASLQVHRSESSNFPQAVPPFCLLLREKRVKMQRKDFFFFSSGDAEKGTGRNPSKSQKLLTWRKRPRTIRRWRKSWDRDSLRQQPLRSEKHRNGSSRHFLL